MAIEIPATISPDQLAPNESIARAAITATCADPHHFRMDGRPWAHDKVEKVILHNGDVKTVEEDLRRHVLSLHARTGCPDTPLISIEVIVV